MVFGNPITMEQMQQIMESFSTRIHRAVHEINDLHEQFAKYSDSQLDEILTVGGSTDPAGDRAAFRAWLAQLKGYADNYSGNGQLDDKSFELAKRVRALL